MSKADDPAQRLERLARILTDGRVGYGGEPDAAAHHLRSVRLDRIARLTQELRCRIGTGADDVDRVTMRLLLDEYTAAVAHLRAVASDSARNIDGAPAALKDVRRFVQHRLPPQEKSLDPIAPSEPLRARRTPDT